MTVAELVVAPGNTTDSGSDERAAAPPGALDALRTRLGNGFRGIAGRRRPPDRYDAWLGLIVLVGLALRVWQVLANRSDFVTGDGNTYYLSARLLADGHGFISATTFGFSQGRMVVPAAEHPPAWILVLAPVALLGAKRIVYFQLTAALVGTATVGVVGLTGRRVAGRRAGLIAAAIAAAYPNLWLYERIMQCETLALLLTAIIVFVAYGFWQRPGRGRAILLGLLVGALSLTRPETVLLVPLLLAPLVLWARSVDRATRLRLLGLGAAMTALVIAPWAVFNTARFHQPVILTTNLGGTLASSNCDATFEGSQIGLWNYQCLSDATKDAIASTHNGSTADLDVAMRKASIDYMRDHLGRVPLVVLAREGRAWGVFQPNDQLTADSIGGPDRDVGHAGLLMYWPIAVSAVAGVVILRRRRVALTPVLAVVGTVVIAVSFTIGQTRYRALAEGVLVLLAAVAIDALVGWATGWRHERAT